jgi:hypothetical protein
MLGYLEAEAVVRLFLEEAQHMIWVVMLSRGLLHPSEW